MRESIPNPQEKSALVAEVLLALGVIAFTFIALPATAQRFKTILPNLKSTPDMALITASHFQWGMAWFFIRPIIADALVLTILTLFGVRICRKILPDRLLNNSGALYSFGAIMGMGVVGWVLFFLGLADAFTPVGIGLVLIICAVIGNQEILPLLEKTRAYLKSKEKRKTDGIVLLMGLLLAVAIIFTFLATLGPVDQGDEQGAHLKYPWMWLNAGGITHIPYSYDNHYPPMAWMIFSTFMSFGGIVGARLAHFIAYLLLIALTFFVTKERFGSRGAIIAALLVGSCPLLSMEGHCGNVDLFWACFTTASVVLMFQAKDNGSLIASALFISFAINTKWLSFAVGLMIAIYFVGRLIFKQISVRQFVIGSTIFSLIPIAINAPFIIRNYVLTGNPVIPFLTNLFNTKGYPDAVGRYSMFVLQEVDNVAGNNPFEIIWKVFVADQWAFGLAILLAMILGFAIYRRKSADAPFIIYLSAFSLGGLLLWKMGMPSFARYLIPYIPLAAMVAGGVIVAKNRPWLRRAFAIYLVMTLAVNLAMVIAMHVGKLPTLANMHFRAQYLNRFDTYRLMTAIKQIAEPSDRILVVGTNRTFYIKELDNEHTNGFDPGINLDYFSMKNGQDLIDTLQDQGFTLVALYGEFGTNSINDQKFRQANGIDERAVTFGERYATLWREFISDRPWKVLFSNKSAQEGMLIEMPWRRNSPSKGQVSLD